LLGNIPGETAGMSELDQQ